MTFNDVFKITVKVLAGCYAVGGALMVAGWKKTSAVLLVLAVTFMIVTENNPTVREQSGANYRNKPYPWASLLRHLSLIGGVLLVLVNEDDFDSTT